MRGKTANVYFNPRSPHGERLPVRLASIERRRNFNPRSPHGERHDDNADICTSHGNFNPRSPHGERLVTLLCVCDKNHFNPRSPHGERRENREQQLKRNHFNPRSPHGERPLLVAPRTGSDLCRDAHTATVKSASCRSPHGERLRKVTILSIRIIGFAQKVYHKTVLLRISLAENAVILPEKPRNPVRTSLQKAGGLRFARAIRAARPYSISSPSGA